MVTGMAVMAGDALDVPGFTSLLRAGRPIVGQDVTGFDWDRWLAAMQARPGETGGRLRRLTRAAATPGLRLTLAVATAAIGGAALMPDATGIVVAGSNLQLGRQWAAFEKFRTEPAYLSPRHGYEFYDTHVMALIAEALGLRGPGMTVGGASASGNVALATALDLVRHGRAAACLVVGPVPELSPAERAALRSMGALSPAGTCRPFDRAASGFAPTGLCAAVLLESETGAARRGAPILAELAGAGCVMGANHLPSPDPDGEWRAMAGALRDGGAEAGDLDLISAHATGTPAGDVAEAAAIRRLLGDRAAAVPVNAPKSLLGHGLHAAGIAELIAVIVQMRGGFVHGTAGLSDPIAGDLFLVGATGLDRRVRLALSNGFGFGSINSAILVRDPEGSS
jgi:malonyl-ACP decarboxylase